MNKIAIDTNILIYLFDSNHPVKTKTADDLLSSNPFISAQVVSEFLNVSKRFLNLPKLSIINKCRDVIANCTIIATTHETLFEAEALITRYDFQIFDAIVVAAAFLADCTILYSEDMHHNQLINNKLSIINPFLQI